jgi:hypothetical protein
METLIEGEGDFEGSNSPSRDLEKSDYWKAVQRNRETA